MEKHYKSIKSYRKDLPPEGYGKSEEEIAEYITNLTEYDAHDHIITEITYNPDNTIEQKYEYKYNDKGKIAEELLYYEDGEIADRKRYEYNEQGNIAKEFIYYQDETFDTIMYMYNPEMNLIEKTTVSYEGHTEEKEILEYSQGKLILHAIFDGTQHKLYETTYQYDEAGNVTELVEWDSETNKKHKTASTYDDGNLIKQLRYVNDILIAKMTFTIDENKRVKQVLDEDANHKNTINIIHDGNGNIIEETEYNFKEELNHKITRKYNDRNDMIESRVFIDTHNAGITQNYVMRYEYVYNDQ